jgi:uncharacterized protein YecE (DUF72 family)
MWRGSCCQLEVAPSLARIGTAGWSLDRRAFPGQRQGTSGLQRYAEYFDTVEINSTFYRLPRAATLERWRDCTPRGFEFTLKVPKAITHEAGLVGVSSEVRELCLLVAHLGPKLGPLLVQLPPSLELDADVARRFFRRLCALAPAPVVCEPRHLSWFTPRAEELLQRLEVARVAADPARCGAASVPGAASSIQYHRWHGSPRMYFSAYEAGVVQSFARQVVAGVARGARVYGIFDNTALGAAAIDARALQRLLLTAPAGAARRSATANSGTRVARASRQ